MSERIKKRKKKKMRSARKKMVAIRREKDRRRWMRLVEGSIKPLPVKRHKRKEA